MSIYTLDTSSVLNLLKLDEQPDEPLLRLVQMGLAGQITVRVSPVIHDEITSSGGAGICVRPYIRQRLEQFPVHEVSAERKKERDLLAERWRTILWPNVKPGSRKHEHGLRDCQHMASHYLCGGSVFVTKDEELLRKAVRHQNSIGVLVMTPEEACKREFASYKRIERPGDHINIAVRDARQDDFIAIQRLLVSLKDTYPDFEAWFNKTLSDSATRMCLGVVESEVAGIAVWKPKDRRVVKLATFFIAEDHRNAGLGQHLLFQQIRSWIAEGYEKAIVTVSSPSAYLLPFFLRYGFRIEGASPRRYQAGETEMVLAKHLLYERVTKDTISDFVERLNKEVFCLPAAPGVQCRDNWFCPPAEPAPRVEWDAKEDALVLGGTDGDESRRFSVGVLEEIFYPLRLALDGRKAYLIPIQPHWAERMMQYQKTQLALFEPEVDKLLLRTDNAYYCSPRYGPDALTNAPVLFYVSAPEMYIAGMARVLECRIDEPESLFLEFSDLGIYGIEDIRNHVRGGGSQKGCAMALRFGWWVPFPKPIGKDCLGEFGVSYPQTITGIDFGKFEKMVNAGGIAW